MSILSGYFGNFEAVEAFDVFFKCESQWVADNGYLEETVTSCRLIVDTNRNRCCSIVDKSLTKLVASKNGAVENRMVAIQAVVSNGNEAWTRSLPMVTSRMTPAPIVEMLQHNDSILLPAIGTIAFPMYYSQAEDFTDQMEAIRYGAVPLEISQKGKESLTVSYKITSENRFTTRRSTVMDRTDMKPISFYETAISPDGTVTPKVRERYKFTDVEGIYLPLELSGERRRPRTVDKVRLNGMETYDVHFQWLSVNKPLKDEYFSQELLNDVKKITDLVNLK